MTILIGAHLDDDTRVLISDGNVFRGDNEKVTSRAQKVRSINDGHRGGKRALVGVSGDRGALQVLCDVIEQYLKSPASTPVDIGYRLMARVKELGVEWESNGLVWVPAPLNTGYYLVSIDGIMSAHVINHQHFWAEGTGRCHALGAFLGLAMMSKLPDEPLSSHLEELKPTIHAVQICYDVACENDAYCGGEQTVLKLS